MTAESCLWHLCTELGDPVEWSADEMLWTNFPKTWQIRLARYQGGYVQFGLQRVALTELVTPRHLVELVRYTLRNEGADLKAAMEA
jgi:hypothetical protein